VKDLGLLDRVRFLGDRRDIPSVLASLDITVLPSASESLSNAIMESMAAGIPVIANRVGGNPELITGERGVLVAADDEQALSAAMESLLRDQDLRTRLDTMLGRMLWPTSRSTRCGSSTKSFMSTSFNGRVHEEHAMQAHF